MANGIAVRVFDPGSATPEGWRAFHALRRARMAEDYPGRAIAPDDAAERDLHRDDPLWCWRNVLACVDGRPVGRLQLTWRREGSPDHARFAGYAMAFGGVVQAHRRQGVGTRLARELLAFMHEQQMALTSFRVPNPAQGEAFLAHLGARETYRDVDNRLRLADASWSGLAGRIEALAPGMRWEVHAGRVPIERLRELAPSINGMLADVPRGTSDQPLPRFEPDAYAPVYERMDARGGMHFLVVGLQGDTVAAVCEADWYADMPGQSNQLFTGVAREFRGRGLAMAVKARMLQLLRERAPAVEMVNTNNAVDNAPMLRVNARLGFQAIRESAVFQLRREDLEARLGQSAPPSTG